MNDTPKVFLPAFPQSLKDDVTEDQLKVLKYFENFPVTTLTTPWYRAVPYSIVYLNQTHFNYGTVRIRSPGFYVLTEDIVFEPNAHNNFFPTATQVKTGLYPMGKDGAYHLGFFAAITFSYKCDDCGGYTRSLVASWYTRQWYEKRGIAQSYDQGYGGCCYCLERCRK